MEVNSSTESRSLDSHLKRLGLLLHDDEKRARLLQKVRKILKRSIQLFCIAYGIFILLLLLSQCFIGEKNIASAFLLYLPRVIFLLPSLFLIPLSFLASLRIAVFVTICAVLYFFLGMGFVLRGNVSPSPSEVGSSITVLSYNRGQHLNQSLQPFKNYSDPDVIALQESPGRAKRYAKAEGYEKFVYTEDMGEFTLLSRYPITQVEEVILKSGTEAKSPAARFVIDFDGRPIAIYSVHVISPRDTLLYYRRGAFLAGVLGLPGTPWAEGRKRKQLFWDRRIAQAEELRKQISEDPLPSLVVGDLNAPAGGFIHRMFRKQLQDAHVESGSGFGYSFPGSTRNPLSGGGPWMRIDYAFCDSSWEPVWCITEKDRPSQHRAITAQFRLTKE